jgi:hypothetical protein
LRGGAGGRLSGSNTTFAYQGWGNTVIGT